MQTELADEYATRLSQILLNEIERRPIKDLSFDLRLVEGRLGVELEDVHEKINEYRFKTIDDDLDNEDPYEAIGMGHDDLRAQQEQIEFRDKFSTLIEDEEASHSTYPSRRNIPGETPTFFLKNLEK